MQRKGKPLAAKRALQACGFFQHNRAKETYEDGYTNVVFEQLQFLLQRFCSLLQGLCAQIGTPGPPVARALKKCTLLKEAFQLDVKISLQRHQALGLIVKLLHRADAAAFGVQKQSAGILAGLLPWPAGLLRGVPNHLQTSLLQFLHALRDLCMYAPKTTVTVATGYAESVLTHGLQHHAGGCPVGALTLCAKYAPFTTPKKDLECIHIWDSTHPRFQRIPALEQLPPTCHIVQMWLELSNTLLGRHTLCHCNVVCRQQCRQAMWLELRSLQSVQGR